VNLVYNVKFRSIICELYSNLSIYILVMVLLLKLIGAGGEERYDLLVVVGY
jgi:hypothetical protein